MFGAVYDVCVGVNWMYVYLRRVKDYWIFKKYFLSAFDDNGLVWLFVYKTEVRIYIYEE